MSLEHAIHRRWSGFAPLTKLVPADRFYTGWLPTGEDFDQTAEPYASLEQIEQRTTRVSSGARLATHVMRFHVWGTDLAVLKRVAERIDVRFDRQAFGAAGLLVQDMKRIDLHETAGGDGLWHVTADYRIRTQS